MFSSDEDELRWLESPEAPDFVPVKIGRAIGKFMNIPKIVARLRRMREEEPEKFEAEMEKARARHRARHRGISP